MELIALVICFVVYIAWSVLRTAGSDCSRKTNKELVQLLAQHQQRLRVASKAGATSYQSALAKTAQVTRELKKRSLMREDEFANDPQLRQVLEQTAQEKFGRSVQDIQCLTACGEPAAMRQLAVLLRIAREQEVSTGYLVKAAVAGDAEAQFALALALFDVDDAQPTDRQAEARQWLNRAAEQGHAHAQKAIKALNKTRVAEVPQTGARVQGDAQLERPLSNRGTSATSQEPPIFGPHPRAHLLG